MPVFEVLEQHGLEVYLVNAQHTKNVPGRKSDVQCHLRHNFAVWQGYGLSRPTTAFAFSANAKRFTPAEKVGFVEQPLTSRQP
jgi:hypothetical protein